MKVEDLVQSLMSMCVLCCLFILSSPDHTPIKYGDPIKKINLITPTYLIKNVSFDKTVLYIM